MADLHRPGIDIASSTPPSVRPARTPVWALAALIILMGYGVVAGQARRRASGPGYFVIQLHGQFGGEVAAKEIKRCMKVGLKSADTVLILDIDSLGGLVSECQEIIELLGKERQRRSIAYVRRALSAAAITALTCDEIYMHSDAILGAAKAIKIGPRGMPGEVEEKFQSVWRATCRRATEIGGHDPEYAVAMIDARAELLWDTSEAGQPRVGRRSDLKEGSARVLCARGELLTLTATEAVRVGLVRAAVPDWMALLNTAEDLADRRLVSKVGRTIMIGNARRFQSADKTLKRHTESFKRECEKARATALGGGSQHRWERHVKAAENALRKMESAIEKFPILRATYGDVVALRKKLKDLRRVVRRNSQRKRD